MKIQKLIYLFPMFLIGCEYPIHGTLNVNSTLSLQDRGHHAFDLAPGNHSMEVKTEKIWDKTELKMKLVDGTGKERKIKIEVPKDVKIPNYAGSFALSSAQIGQPFNLNGKLVTTESDTPSTVTFESCNFRGYYGYYYYDRGKREITSHQHTRKSDIEVDFIKEGTTDVLASYQGDHSETYEIIERIGSCYYYP